MDHHMAATFLLLGWYLMVPPLVDREGELKPDPRARLSDWQHIDSYVSAETCRHGINDHLQRIGESAIPPSDKSAAIAQTELTNCVESGDARLKVGRRNPPDARSRASGP
jgi:hypothetical protein